jgi:hypothetical protein
MALDYECGHCGFTSPITVVAKGGAPGGDMHSALQSSADDAGMTAADALLYIPCPRCGGVDEFGPRYKLEVRVRAMLLWLGVTVLGGAVAWLKSPGAPDGAAWLVPAIAAIFGLVPALAYYGKRRRAWAHPCYRFPDQKA